MEPDQELIDILACPKCKGNLEYRPSEAFICHECRLLYPVLDGIPNFLIEEARPLTE